MAARKKKMRPLTEAQKEAVAKNVGLIRRAVNGQKQYIASRKDDDQDAAIALIKAVKGFKKNRGVRLSTYAVRAIRNELLSKKAEDGLIRVPKYLNERKNADSRLRKHAEVARSVGDIDAVIDASNHPAAPEDDEPEFGYRAMRAVRWAVQKLPPVERDVVRGLVFRGESKHRLGAKHGISMKNVEAVKLQAFAKLRASLQKHV